MASEKQRKELIGLITDYVESWTHSNFEDGRLYTEGELDENHFHNLHGDLKWILNWADKSNIEDTDQPDSVKQEGYDLLEKITKGVKNFTTIRERFKESKGSDIQYILGEKNVDVLRDVVDGYGYKNISLYTYSGGEFGFIFSDDNSPSTKLIRYYHDGKMETIENEMGRDVVVKNDINLQKQLQDIFKSENFQELDFYVQNPKKPKYESFIVFEKEDGYNFPVAEVTLDERSGKAFIDHTQYGVTDLFETGKKVKSIHKLTGARSIREAVEHILKPYFGYMNLSCKTKCLWLSEEGPNVWDGYYVNGTPVGEFGNPNIKTPINDKKLNPR